MIMLLAFLTVFALAAFAGAGAYFAGLRVGNPRLIFRMADRAFRALPPRIRALAAFATVFVIGLILITWANVGIRSFLLVASIATAVSLVYMTYKGKITHVSARWLMWIAVLTGVALGVSLVWGWAALSDSVLAAIETHRPNTVLDWLVPSGLLAATIFGIGLALGKVGVRVRHAALGMGVIINAVSLFLLYQGYPLSGTRSQPATASVTREWTDWPRLQLAAHGRSQLIPLKNGEYAKTASDRKEDFRLHIVYWDGLECDKGIKCPSRPMKGFYVSNETDKPITVAYAFGR